MAGVQNVYESRASAIPNGPFITTIGGFHRNKFLEGRLPTSTELDDALPNHPVFVSYGFSGPGAINSLVRAFFEPLKDSPFINVDGNIALGTDNGKTWPALRQQLTLEDRKRSVSDAMAYAASLGITTHLDHGAFPATGTSADGATNEDLDSMHLSWLSLYDDSEGTIRLRINFLHMDDTIDVPTDQQRLLNTFKFFSNDMVRTGSIGEFVTADYTGGMVFEEAARRIARAGWRLELHSLTDTDFQTQIQAFDNVSSNVSITDLRWVIAYILQITQEYLERPKKLGVGVELDRLAISCRDWPQRRPTLQKHSRQGVLRPALEQTACRSHR
ncbi:hypothetical protein SCUP234_03849 [Seiridium cupressi]